jgi:hypothetical protein
MKSDGERALLSLYRQCNNMPSIYRSFRVQTTSCGASMLSWGRSLSKIYLAILTTSWKVKQKQNKTKQNKIIILLLGTPYTGSIYEQNSWLNVTSYYAMTITSYYLQDKQNWLDFADHAIDLVPKLMPCLYKVK